jgi:DNA-directed RNA polymerase II subunit RPB2
MAEFNWDRDNWKILDVYFRDTSLVRHQLESYNDFIETLIPQIIERNNPILVNLDYDKEIDKFRKIYEIKFGETFISKPIIHENNDIIKNLLPSEARKRGLTYQSPLYVDVEHTLKIYNDSKKDYNIYTNKEEKIKIAEIPTMVQSKYCHLSDKTSLTRTELGEGYFDNGGELIINGSEKVVVAQERICENRTFVFQPNKNPNDKYKCKVEIKTSIDQRFYPTKSNFVVLTNEPSIASMKKDAEFIGKLLKVQMPQIKDDIPLFIMFRALGITDDQSIYEMILSDIKNEKYANYVNIIYYSTEECRREDIYTQNEALEYLSGKLKNHFEGAVQITPGLYAQQANDQLKMNYVRDVINREFLPHVGHNNLKKAYYLGYMTKRLLDAFLGVRPYDDRDNYQSKRLDITGTLLSQPFRSCWLNFIKEVRKNIINHLVTDPDKLHPNIRKVITSNNITSTLTHCLATGNWGGQKSSTDTSKKGIAQVLNRTSYTGTLSHSRRIQSPLAMPGSKIIKPRSVDQTHYGMNCIDETPEGQQVGIVKNLALQCYVTIHEDDRGIRLALTKFPEFKDITTVSPNILYNCNKIFVNGDLVGVVQDNKTNLIYSRLKTMKRHGIIIPYTSVSWYIEFKEIHIQTDGGRYTRPLFIVNSNTNQLLIAELYNSDNVFKEAFDSINSNETGALKWIDLITGNYPRTTKEGTKINMNNGALIEYLDTNELDCSMVAHNMNNLNMNTDMFLKYTHCEINPMMQKGVVAQMIPFSNHNQSPRNCYQCLDARETVLMADGTFKCISDIVVNDNVISVDPVTLERKKCTVINQYVKNTNKPIIKLTTITGRSVICTDDHPILTNFGWKKAGMLYEMDQICITPANVNSQKSMIDNEYIRYCNFMKINFHKINFQDKNYLVKLGEFSKLITIENDAMYVPIFSIDQHENVLIADITIDDDVHSFITGNEICVHNSSMGKQAIGYYATNYNSRLDTMAHVLIYGHKPPCSTRTMKYTMMDQVPHGATAILAYCTYSGYNQEDAKIMNKDAVQRGFFNTLYFRTYVSEAVKHKSTTQNSEIFKNPKTEDKVRGYKKGSYDSINPNGMPIEGKFVGENGIIVGKLLELAKDHTSEFKYSDVSTILRKNEEGTIDRTLPGNFPQFKNIRNINSEGNEFIKARVSSFRQPETGDKFASRHSQKGTVGLLAKQIDLPHTDSGLCPDIIMNPHGIPTRMTNAKLIETYLGKISVASAKLQDGTPFIEHDFDNYKTILASYGFEPSGNEVMYSGLTNQMFEAEIYIGPTYYQRLKHMVKDKIHSRESGPVQLLVRQPTEGRSKEGGLKVGEMERDVLIAHGGQAFLKEKLIDCSDKFSTYLSTKEKTFIAGNKSKNIYLFNGKDVPMNQVAEIQLPYAMKLALQELTCMGFDIQLNVNENKMSLAK